MSTGALNRGGIRAGEGESWAHQHWDSPLTLVEEDTQWGPYFTSLLGCQ